MSRSKANVLPEWVEELRERHHSTPYPDPSGFGGKPKYWCRACWQEYPCDVIRILDVLEMTTNALDQIQQRRMNDSPTRIARNALAAYREARGEGE